MPASPLLRNPLTALRRAGAGLALAAVLPAHAATRPLDPQAAPAVTPVRVEYVPRTPPPQRQPELGLVVLDLGALESAEAALEMARSWHARHGAARPLTCWLAAPSRSESAEALALLTQGGSPPCERILVPR